MRVAFVLAWDPPLLFTHQYNYFTNGLRIAEHADPLGYVLSSDEWRAWVGGSTIAPLYYLFLGGFFRLFGPGLAGLRVIQGALDALVAVAAAALGRRLAGPVGLLAGVAYAFYWSAVEMTCWTMTENLHTVLLASSLALMAREASSDAKRPGAAALGGLLLGLSGLTRSVSSAFVPVAALWRLLRGGRSWPALRRNAAPAALLLAGGLAAIFAWSARNRWRGDNVPIETVGFYNLWDDNSRPLLSPERYDRQLKMLESQPTPGDYGNTALAFTARNVWRNPGRFLGKVASSFRHFIRPEGLHNLLMKEYPDSEARLLGAVVFDDVLLLVALPLFAAFLMGGRPSPTRSLAMAWTAYYVFMVLVVFHSETRYRSPLIPVVLAGAVAGFQALRGNDPRRPWARAGLLLGGALSLFTVARYVGPIVAAVRSTRALAGVTTVLDHSDMQAAQRTAETAAALDPNAARPWRTFGRVLAARDLSAEAVTAYERAARSPSAFDWTSAAVLPRLLLDAGRTEEAEAALRRAHLLSWDVDPWLLLEAAWHDLPAPRTDEIRLGGFDYGAVRGFHHPRGLDPNLIKHRREFRSYATANDASPPPGLHRWSRGTAFVRLRPTHPAPGYRLTVAMGSPFPAPITEPTVSVSINGAPAQSIRLGPEVREYAFDTPAAKDGVLLVRLDTPTWSRVGEPAGEGVRVDAVRVEPRPRWSQTSCDATSSCGSIRVLP